MPEPPEPDPELDEPVERSRRRRVVGVLASLIVPGSGQFALGFWGRGLLWFLALPIAMIASRLAPLQDTLVIGDILAALVVRLAAALDAAFVRGTGPRPSRRRVLVAWVLLAIGAWSWMIAWERFYRHWVNTDVMAEALLRGDSLLVDGRGYETTEPRRGNLVSLTYKSRLVVLRVVGVPGDTVQMRKDRVLVGNQVLDEPYRGGTPGAAEPDGCAYLFGCEPIQVPTGSFFLLGDNREAGQDSRYWGFITRDKIMGRPILIYWSSPKSFADSPRWERIGRRPQ